MGMKTIRAVTCISRHHDGDGGIEQTSDSDEDYAGKSIIPPLHGFYDDVIRKQMTLSIDFLKPFQTYSYDNPGAFGSPEAGGFFGFAAFTIEKHTYWFIPLSFVLVIICYFPQEIGH
jgi:hypothetical protein